MRPTRHSLAPFAPIERSPRAPRPGVRWLPLVGAIGVLAGHGLADAQFVPATTLPTVPVLRAGAATVVTNGVMATQTITQTSARAAIDWASFSIGQSATVQINQPSAQSILLNRVIGNGNGPGLSAIEGALTANGRVFLLNTAGILFGSDARVNVGGLLASTLDLVNGNLPATTTAFLTANSLDLAAGTPAPVYVLPASSAQPQIQAAAGGEVLLVGNYALAPNNGRFVLLSPAAFPYIGSVTLAGNIATQGGQVHLAAGDSATVSLPVGASGFVTLSNIGAATRAVGIVTGASSNITNPGGSVTLEAVSQGTLGAPVPMRDPIAFGQSGLPPGLSAVIADGAISARNATAQPSSRIDFRSSGALSYAIVSGTVDATGSGAGASGGSIGAAAQNIGLLSLSKPGTTALLDASGAAGGGSITLGGSATGFVQIVNTSTLRANASVAGDGGLISAEASYYNPTQPGIPAAGIDFGVASIGGRFEAIGAGSGHHGGTIATSGAALNIASARIDASGQSGATPGQWRIDPYDVTISNAAPTVVTAFAPTGPGANIRAADIGNALDSGTDVWVGTGTGGAAAGGTITLQPGVAVQRSAGAAPVTLTLAAANAVVLRAGSTIASSAGPLNLAITADTDASGFGGIRISEGNTSIVTRGGNVVFSGGVDPASGFARGTALFDAGVDLANATIDTRASGGAGVSGDVTLRGQGYIGSGYDTPGVRLVNTGIDANNVSVLGRSGDSNAVQLDAGTRIATASGAIDVRGIADPSGSIASASSVGVEIGTGTQLLTGSGSLRLAGRGSAAGVVLGDLLIGSTDNAGAGVVIAGQAVAGTAAGVRFNPVGSGLEIRGTSGANGYSGADIVVGGKASAGAANALDLGPGALPRVLTRGHLNLRPLGVDANGNITDDVGTPIYIGNSPNFSNSPATNFVVRTAWLTPVSGSAGGVTADAGTVIGSNLHSGRITLENVAPVGAALLRLSLQNEGAGSAGIAVGGNLTADALGLLTAGDVSQTTPVAVNQLLIRGAATSTVDLSNAANRIATLAFDPPRSLSVRTQGDLTVGSTMAPALDAASGRFTTLSFTASRAGDRALLQSLNGSLILDQPITLSAPNSQLDLVAATLFQNPSAATLLVGAGGAWRVWSQTWQGGNRGGLAGTAPAANLYGCAFGDTGSCSVSGALIPATGNHFLYRSQPTLTVAADNQSFLWGQPVPALTYVVGGLVNADPAAEVLSGAPSTTATSVSPVRPYPIDAGTLAAHNGYRLAFTPGMLDITAPAVVTDGSVRALDFAGFTARQRSDVYGLNFSLPNICTAASYLRDQNEADTQGTPPLAIEWARVRNQPQLTSCLNERNASECAGF